MFILESLGSFRVVQRSVKVVCCLLFFVPILGNQSAFAEMRQHGTHLHGLGKLNIALADNELHVELESPAANIVGFEHEPKNHEQEEMVLDAIKQLRSGEQLFIISPKAECQMSGVDVEQDMLHEEEEHNGHQEHGKHGDHHDEQHHADEHDHHDQDSVDTHSEFHTHYRFLCKQSQKIQSIDVMLFSYFHGLEELDVQLLTPARQTALKLTPKQYRIEL